MKVDFFVLTRALPSFDDGPSPYSMSSFYPSALYFFANSTLSNSSVCWPLYARGCWWFMIDFQGTYWTSWTRKILMQHSSSLDRALSNAQPFLSKSTWVDMKLAFTLGLTKYVILQYNSRNHLLILLFPLASDISIQWANRSWIGLDSPCYPHCARCYTHHDATSFRWHWYVPSELSILYFAFW